MAEGALEGGLHLHVAELGDGEVQVIEGVRPLVGIVLKQQLGELEAGEGDFGPEAGVPADI